MAARPTARPAATTEAAEVMESMLSAFGGAPGGAESMKWELDHPAQGHRLKRKWARKLMVGPARRSF